MPGGEAFALEENPGGSAQQIVSEGGEKNDEYLAVSKIISGTDAENVFDITLRVVTRRKIEELYNVQNTDIVIVMDVSNTMTNLLGDGTSRYNAALESAKGFINTVHQVASAKDAAGNRLATLRLGFVAFNSDSKQIFTMTLMGHEEVKNDLISLMETETGKIINDPNYEDSNFRYTNIESGLKRGRDMLADSKADNKYLVFLSDGFPTTYIKTGYDYDGYSPPATGAYTSSIADGIFTDRKRGKPCPYGSSYSDKAAEKAVAMAQDIKDAGVKIFSVGVGLGDQTIQDYIDSFEDKWFTVVDCYNDSYKNPQGKDYVICNADDETDYKNLLKTNIGSDIYYDSENSQELADAFNSIFEIIKLEVEEKIQASWTVSDPMGAMGAAKVEFISLYDREGKFSADAHNLSGELGEGKENTVSVKDGAISWNLWRSGYTSLSQGNSTLYNYELTYRVRLENELKNFAEGSRVDTNGTTTLSYIHDKNGSLTPGSIDFPVPAVKGWLGELRFTKKNNSGDILPGAEFTLSHNDNCSVCAAIYPGGWKVDIGPKTAASATNGSVVFRNIPSGHDYSLTETNVPTGYLGVGSLPVTVDYDKLKVNGAADFESLVNFASCKLTVYKIISGDFSSADFVPGSFTIELIDAATDKLLREVSLPTEDGKWEYTFSGLPAGRYKLHESHWSIPQEGYVCRDSYIYPENG
ncbi:MAG: VWA domain-containing protein, partial [Clostridia bacterium]|nr:VWA domain-containing protein [Clostridia bacterium]